MNVVSILGAFAVSISFTILFIACAPILIEFTAEQFERALEEARRLCRDYLY